jgi:putative ABC transport system permease protein
MLKQNKPIQTSKSLQKDSLRTLGKSKARFLSILAMITLGVAFFAGINATGPDMLQSADTYYKQQNLADFRIVSPLGFRDEDIAKLQATSGVAKVQPGYTKDLFLTSPAGTTNTVRLFSYDAAVGSGRLSQPVIKAGRLPENSGEIAIESGNDVPKDIQLGSKLTVAVPKDEKLSDSLKASTFTVVGFIESPMYISWGRGQTNIGDGSISYYAYIDKTDFTQERYSDLLVQTTDSSKFVAYSAAYKAHITPIQKTLDALGITTVSAETQQLRSDLSDSKKELQTSKEKAEEELADGAQKLTDAQQKISDGEKTLNNKETKYTKLFADQRKELDDGKAELKKGWATYNKSLATWQAGYNKYKAGAASAAENKTKLDAAAVQIAQGEKELAGSKAQLDAAKAQLDGLTQSIAGLTGVRQGLPADDATLTEAQFTKILSDVRLYSPDLSAQLQAAFTYDSPGVVPGIKAAIDSATAQMQASEDSGMATYNAGLAQYNDGLAKLTASKEQYTKGLAAYNAGMAELVSAKAQLDSGKKQLNTGKATLNANQSKLSKGEEELTKGEADLAAALADGRKKLTDSKAELDKGQKDYITQKADAEAKIADAETKIRDAERKIVEIPQQWYVWGRDNNPGYAGYGDDANRISAVAKVFPLFFFLVAALVCLTTMTRMVEEERGQIGALKALGYSTLTIASKYLAYALLASALGTVIGLVLGYNLFPGVIIQAYSLMYHIPVRLTLYPVGYSLLSFLLAVVTTVAAALMASLQELRATPAILMQTKAPKAGKRILLERIGPLWRRLSFSYKVTARNIFRYKKRLLMTVIGIAGCTALLVTGFGLKDSVNAIMGKQFDTIFLYDGMAFIDTDKAPSVQSMAQLVAGESGVETTMKAQNETVNALASASGRTYEATLFIPESTDQLSAYVSLHDRQTQKPIALPDDGAVISEKLSQLLHVSVGGTFSYQDSENRNYTIKVSAITENYMSHYIYMSPAYFDKVTVRSPDYNTIVFNFDYPEAVDEQAVKTDLMSHDGIAGTMFTKNIAADFQKEMKPLNYVVLVLILSAGALAFIVLYNLTNINITERIREIATIKVLGFRDREVSAYVYRETILLTIFGTAAGLVLGVFMHHLVMGTMETDVMMFGRSIAALSYVLSIVLTFAFSIFVNIFMYYKLRRVKMVESLKSVE